MDSQQLINSYWWDSGIDGNVELFVHEESRNNDGGNVSILKENDEVSNEISCEAKTSQENKPLLLQSLEEKEVCSSELEILKCVYMKFTPIIRHLKTSQVFILAGDVLVDLDLGRRRNEDSEAQYCEISALNEYKNAVRVSVLNDYYQNEIDLTASNESLNDFSQIATILENYPDKQTHEYGLILKQYQQYVVGQLKKAQYSKNNEQFKQIEAQMEDEFESFVQQSRTYLKQLYSSNQKDQYCFHFVIRPNMHTFIYDINRIGLSQSLCEVLGGTSHQISSLIVRRGIFEFFSKKTRNDFYFEYLSKFLNMPLSSSNEDNFISLITLDGIELKVQYKMKIKQNDKPNVLFFYPYSLIVISFEITDHILQQLYKMRNSLKEQTQMKIQEFSNDIYYSLETQIFLDKYYKNTSLTPIVEHLSTEEIFQPIIKQKRKYNKHPHSQHQLDFRIQNGKLYSKKVANYIQKNKKFISKKSINNIKKISTINTSPLIQSKSNKSDISLYNISSPDLSQSHNNNSTLQSKVGQEDNSRIGILADSCSPQ